MTFLNTTPKIHWNLQESGAPELGLKAKNLTHESVARWWRHEVCRMTKDRWRFQTCTSAQQKFSLKWYSWGRGAHPQIRIHRCGVFRHDVGLVAHWRRVEEDVSDAVAAYSGLQYPKRSVAFFILKKGFSLTLSPFLYSTCRRRPSGWESG